MACTVRSRKRRVSSRAIRRTSSAASGGSSVISRTVIQPASVTTTASARSSSSGIRSTRLMVVCLSGGASSRPVSRVAEDRWDEACSMKPSTPARRGARASPASPRWLGGGNDSTSKRYALSVGTRPALVCGWAR